MGQKIASSKDRSVAVKMKITLSNLLVSATLFSGAHGECTHGRLFISDANTTIVRSYNLDGPLGSMVSTATVPVPGGAPLTLDATNTGLNVIASFWGTATSFLTDGRVSFIYAGVEKEIHDDHFHLGFSNPSLYSDSYPCGPVYHTSSHDNKLVLFCDGSFTASPQRNTTIAVFDEARLGLSGAWLANYTLQGTHHGGAMAVDDGHILHSLATQNRIDRVPGASSLPDTFQVVDYAGTVLHTLSDTGDWDKHCRGFHGSAAVDNSFILACGVNGLLGVHYNETSGTYVSNDIEYPTLHALVGYRTGGFQYHPKSKIVVGNFNQANTTLDYYLIGVPTSADRVWEYNMLNLGATWSGACPRGFELADGKHFLIMMPDGTVRAYTVDEDGWDWVAEKQVITGLTSCAGLLMAPGYHQAFIAHRETQKLYALNLEKISQGIIDVAVTDLGYAPYSAVVSGVPEGTACKAVQPPAPTAPPFPRCVALGGRCAISSTQCCSGRVCIRTTATGPRTCRACKRVTAQCFENRDCCSTKCVLRRGTGGGKFCAR
jgi:hypothetical protein